MELESSHIWEVLQQLIHSIFTCILLICLIQKLGESQNNIKKFPEYQDCVKSMMSW